MHGVISAVPLVSEVEVRRSVDSNVLQLTATLDYTGGGTITHFTVYFRPLGTNVWTLLSNFIATAVNGSSLIWTTQVMDDRFQDSAVELQVLAVNSNNYASNIMEQSEEIGKT